MDEKNMNSTCKNPACKALMQPDEPFCRKCWSKNLTENGELVGADRVITVSTPGDLDIAVKDYCEKYPLDELTLVSGQLILVEGPLSKEVAQTFGARLEYAARWRREVATGLIGVSASLLAVYAGRRLYLKSMSKPYITKDIQKFDIAKILKMQGLDTTKGADLMKNVWDIKENFNTQQVKEWSDKFWENKEVISAVSVIGGVATEMTLINDRHKIYLCMMLANTVDDLYRAGFRIKGSRGEYVVIERDLRLSDRAGAAVLDSAFGVARFGEDLGVWNVPQKIRDSARERDSQREQERDRRKKK